MIKLIEKNNLEAAKKYCEGDPFGCRILATMLSYGLDKPFAMFWAQYSDSSDRITAVISRLDAAMTVCAKGSYDTEELDCFIQTMIGHASALRPTREGEAATGLVMRLAERKIKEDDSGVTVNPEISDLYAVMEECGNGGFEVPQFDAFYSDMMYRTKAKTALSAVLNADGMPASCCAMHITESTALLTMCASAPDYRGKGYASRLISVLLDKAGKRDIYLMCLPSLYEFYNKFGFVTAGGYVY